MLTLNQKRKIRLELELQKLNINGYRYLLRGYKGIEILTETEFETLIQELKKQVINTEYKINNKDISVKITNKEKDIYFNITVKGA